MAEVNTLSTPNAQPTASPAAALNTIPSSQNLAPQLTILAAQRAVYWEAKRWVVFQILLTTAVVIAITVIGDQTAWWRPWGALVGVLILFGDNILFDAVQRRLRRKGAKVQELFDCRVLGLGWNEFLAGARPADEEVNEYAARYREFVEFYGSEGAPDRELAKLRDWYSPAVARVPQHVARVICQRSNVSWDSKLRRRYASVVLTFTTAAFALPLAWGLFRHYSLGDFVLVLAGLSPLLAWGGREFHAQREAADNLDRLREGVNGLWARLLRGGLTAEECGDESRSLQDAIFDHRRNSPVVLEWVYERLRDKNEGFMNVTAAQMVDDFNSAGLGDGGVGHGRALAGESVAAAAADTKEALR